MHYTQQLLQSFIRTTAYPKRYECRAIRGPHQRMQMNTLISPEDLNVKSIVRS